jgi:hypothetical protein
MPFIIHDVQASLRKAGEVEQKKQVKRQRSDDHRPELDHSPGFFYGSLIMLIVQGEGVFTHQFDHLPSLAKLIYLACLALMGAAVVIDFVAVFLRRRNLEEAHNLAWSIHPRRQLSSAFLAVAFSGDGFIGAWNVTDSRTSAFMIVAAFWVLAGGFVVVVRSRMRNHRT